MIFDGRFRFTCPPKAGTHYIVENLVRNGIVPGYVSGLSACHVPAKGSQLPSLTVIRPHDDWIRSYFDNFTSPVNCPEVDALLVLRRDNFDAFIRQFIDEMPGQVGKIFAAYQSDHTIRLGDHQKFESVMQTLGYPQFRVVSEWPNKTLDAEKWNEDLRREFNGN